MVKEVITNENFFEKIEYLIREKGARVFSFDEETFPFTECYEVPGEGYHVFVRNMGKHGDQTLYLTEEDATEELGRRELQPVFDQTVTDNYREHILGQGASPKI